MSKYVAPDRGVKETVIGGKSYFANRGGLYNVENKAHQKAMEAEGFFQASLMGGTSSTIGFTCIECGFGSFFRKCSRCGHVTGTPERDGE